MKTCKGPRARPRGPADQLADALRSARHLGADFSLLQAAAPAAGAGPAGKQP